MSQWVSGFNAIIREEPDLDTKNLMLDYLTGIMEDSQDFGWPSVKGAHVVLLSKWSKIKYNGMKLQKLIGSEGHMPRRSVKIHIQIIKSRTNQYHVNFTKRVPVGNQMTMRMMVNYIFMLVQIVLVQEKLTPTQHVNAGVQEMSTALHCSAKC